MTVELYMKAPGMQYLYQWNRKPLTENGIFWKSWNVMLYRFQSHTYCYWLGFRSQVFLHITVQENQVSKYQNMLKNYFEFRHRFVIFTIVTDANDIKKWIVRVIRIIELSRNMKMSYGSTSWTCTPPSTKQSTKKYLLHLQIKFKQQHGCIANES